MHGTFIHIPKNGGTSVFTALWSVEELHKEFHLWKSHDIGLKRLETLYAVMGHDQSLEFWHNSFKFTFVRNPWDRRVSLYHAFRSNIDDILSFQDWMVAGCPINHDFNSIFVGDVDADILNQRLFYTNREGNLMVDFVGRFECLQRDFDTICRHMQVKPFALEHHNKSEPRDYRSYYKNNEAKDLVAERDKLVVEQFGYDF